MKFSEILLRKSSFDRRQFFKSLKVDLHSHVLPGIDDGAKNMEEAIRLVEELQDMGYKKIVATPHVRQEYYPNSTRTIINTAQRLNHELKQKGYSILVETGAEYYLDEEFRIRIAQNDILSFADGRVLIELSLHSEIPDTENYIFALTSKGYRPILAHPERYLYYYDKLNRLRRFREMGCGLQLNWLSLTNFYNAKVRKMAEKLLRLNLIDYVSTDVHDLYQLDLIKKMFDKRKNQRILSDYPFKNSEIFSNA